jgi:hypothetical protein
MIQQENDNGVALFISTDVQEYGSTLRPSLAFGIP